VVSPEFALQSLGLGEKSNDGRLGVSHHFLVPAGVSRQIRLPWQAVQAGR